MDERNSVIRQQN